MVGTSLAVAWKAGSSHEGHEGTRRGGRSRVGAWVGAAGDGRFGAGGVEENGCRPQALPG